MGAIAVTLAGATVAQTSPPDAGSILRGTDPSHRLVPAPAGAPGVRSATPSPRGADTLRVRISAVRVTGATRYSESQLQALVSDLVGREVDYLELRNAADRITRHYRADGWFARAYLPEQALDSGVLTIAVIEARVGAINIEHPARPNVRESAIRAMLLAGQSEHDALALPALERAAMLIDDLPGIAANVVLAPGASIGATDVFARVENTTRLQGQVETDNHGITATGRERLTGQLTLASPARLGDELAAVLNVSTGNRFARLGYELPAGAHGWRIGAAASVLEYELGDEFKALDAHGRAATWSATGSYPIVRSNGLNARFVSAYEERRYENFALGVQTSDSLVRAARGGITLGRLDTLGGGGLMQYSAQLTRGSVDLSANASDLALDALTARSDGYYSKLTWNVTRVQRLGTRDRLLLSVYGQESSRNLDSSERLSLGGASGVRAYPELEASGDEGWVASAEWLRTLGSHWSVALFYDMGLITQHERAWQGWNAGRAGLRNHYTLDGAGTSISWSSQTGLEVRATIATRFGDNPGADPASGRDNDGSQREPQLWITARWRL